MAVQVDPRGMTFMQWAATVAQDERNIPLPMSEQFWRGWARGVTQVNAAAPHPDTFINWEDWAIAWIRSE